MEYTRGRDYIANLHMDGGFEAVAKAMSGPLPIWLQFVRVAMRKNKPKKQPNALPKK